MIRGASIIFIGQDRKKLIFSDNDTESKDAAEKDLHDKLMHRKEAEDS